MANSDFQAQVSFVTNLRILSVTLGEPTPFDSQGLRTITLLEGLKNRGNDVRLVSLKTGRSFSSLTYDLDKITRSLFEYKPDLVLANTHFPAFVFAVNKFGKAPLVFDMHGSAVNEIRMLGDERGFLRARSEMLLNFVAEYFAAKLSDKILCVSHSMIGYLRRTMKVALNKMEYVTNGVDLDLFKSSKDSGVLELRRRLGFENKFVFGYIGGFQKWQGVEMLLAAAGLVSYQEVGFLMVGGDNTDVWRNVVKLRKMPREQLPFYYSVCDVLVLPRPKHIATEVAAPTKFSEYVAMGKPVLVTDVGDVSSLVKRHKCGIIVHDNRPRNLVDGINAFTELSTSKLREMGRRSRRLAEEEFDWNKILANLDHTLTRLVESS